jgi:hypothetical protein
VRLAVANGPCSGILYTAFCGPYARAAYPTREKMGQLRRKAPPEVRSKTPPEVRKKASPEVRKPVMPLRHEAADAAAGRGGGGGASSKT